jgi:predicted kinase
LSIFIMLIGIPGSGKSTLAESLAKSYNAVLISTDQLRFQYTGSEANRTRDGLVFAAAHQKIRSLLEEDTNVIYDATNISLKERKRILTLLPERTLRKCYFKRVSLSAALNRNAQRKRIVPEQVILKMYENLQPPTHQEGWDEIKVIQD